MSLRLPGSPLGIENRLIIEMARAVRYFFDGRDWEVAFRQGSARLPIYNAKTRRTVLVPWGRRPNDKGRLPLGGIARHNNIQGNQWDQWQPRGVRLAIKEFMQVDVTDNPHWFEVTEGHWLHGLVATSGNEQRVYIVSLEMSPEEIEFESWPKFISGL